MDKIASDAYSQGAYEALQQMQVSGHVKQAAANYLIKEANLLQKIKGLPAAIKGYDYKGAAGAVGDRLKTLHSLDARKGISGVSGMSADDIAKQLTRDRIAAGIGGAGLLAGGAGLAGAFDDPEPEGWDALTPGQQAAIIGGGAAAVGGAGYGLSQLM